MKNKNYELWAIGFTAEEECTDFDVLIAEFPHTNHGKEDGIQKLRTITADEIKKITNIPEEVKLLDLALEECADFSDTEHSAIEIVGTRWISTD